MITAQRAFNTVEKLFTNSDGYVISLDDASALTHSDEVERVFELQRKLQKLGLNEEENCILAAMCVMFAGWLSEIIAIKCCLKHSESCFSC
jgi:hypothetical protein